MDNTDLPERYPHLDPPALTVIEGDVATRRKYLEFTLRDEIWIPNNPSDSAIEDLLGLLNSPDSLRPECRFIVGPSNNGKSRILGRFAAAAKRLAQREPDGLTMPVLMIQAPENPSIGGFFSQILRALKAPEIKGNDARKIKDSALRICRDIGLRVLVIDEAQHLGEGTPTHRGQCLNAIKSMTTELGRAIVMAGTPEAIAVMTSMEQVENRFRPRYLDLWELDEDFLDLLASFEGALPLRQASGLDAPELAGLIHCQSEGRIGEVYYLLRNAAIEAIRSGSERIDLKLLKRMDYKGPTQRSKALKAFAQKFKRVA